MAEWLDRYGSIEAGNKALTGQQHYFLEVKGPAYGVALSVVSFEAVEKIGEGQQLVIDDSRSVPDLVPLTVKSPSGVTRWICGAPVGRTATGEEVSSK